jgi:protein-disulfide isomerase
VLKVAKKFPVGEVEVKKYESLSPEGKKAGILLTPTVIINEKVVSAGRGLSEKDYEKLIRAAQGANN